MNINGWDIDLHNRPINKQKSAKIMKTMEDKLPVHQVRWQDRELDMYGPWELPTALGDENKT